MDCTSNFSICDKNSLHPDSFCRIRGATRPPTRHCGAHPWWLLALASTETTDVLALLLRLCRLLSRCRKDADQEVRRMGLHRLVAIPRCSDSLASMARTEATRRDLRRMERIRQPPNRRVSVLPRMRLGYQGVIGEASPAVIAARTATGTLSPSTKSTYSACASRLPLS